MNLIDLFSGIGGFSLGLEPEGFNTVLFVEQNEWCIENALKPNWPTVPIIKDIRNVTRERLRSIGIEYADIITAGVPCQPASIIGKREGDSDSRWLWPDTLRIIEELEPAWVICENPTGLLTLDGGGRFGEIIQRLSKAGYVCWWETIPASAVGAGHRRERVWIIAHLCGERLERFPWDGKVKRQTQQNGSVTPEIIFPARDTEWWWKDKSPVPIVVDGVSNPAFWKQAIIATGNAVVPQIPRLIGRAIIESEE